MEGSLKELAQYRMQRAKEISYLREKSDYDDFYIASKDEAKNQLENAEDFLKKISEYLDEN